MRGRGGANDGHVSKAFIKTLQFGFLLAPGMICLKARKIAYNEELRLPRKTNFNAAQITSDNKATGLVLTW